jgi:protein-L-isoaspartate(D-aspartate) O-methyltransferase
MHVDSPQIMVEEQIVARGITDQAVIAAMQEVPRELFVPKYLQNDAYEDSPLPIGYSQTISQPYIVALMTELADIDKDSKVLEIGTGSGYQAAILAHLCKEVYTIEIIESLGKHAQATLQSLNLTNVHVIIGDGHEGLPSQAPFDAIIVTAAPKTIPRALVEQLKKGGRLVIPVGSQLQNLEVITKTASGSKKETIIPVMFVPLVKK